MTDMPVATKFTSQNKVLGGVVGVMGGAVFGIVSGIFLIIIGVLLCATIIGAILGIPLILFGLGMVITGPFSGLAAGLMGVKAPCPYCQNTLSFTFNKKALTCKYCRKRLLVRGKELMLVE